MDTHVETHSPASQPEQARRYFEERRSYWDHIAQSRSWARSRRGYQARLSQIYRFVIPPGARVLELGCGSGNLLAAVRPSVGVGVDFSARMIEQARSAHPELTFFECDVHELDLGETFDFIICSDLINDLWDVQRVFEAARRHAHAGTKLILNVYSHLWQIPRRIAEIFGLAQPLLLQNWLTPADTRNLLTLSGWETVRASHEILDPFGLPLLGSLANRFLVKLWPFASLGITNVIVARPAPQPRPGPPPVVSVIVAARNEAGNIASLFDQLPQMGAGTELIFVEGNSRDDTWGAIEREIARRPAVNARLFKQPGKGKGDAVRKGFAEARGELLMILDADLTVAPQDLPHFYEAWQSGKAEFVNGVRLVYPMRENAMRFFNLLGNKFFSLAFSWLLSQNIKDTLCGTKVLAKKDYEMIAAQRSYFGDFDPFGDFDLIFGAAKYNLKMVDMPVRYRDRVYGETNIQRWSHGLLLLRMVLYAMSKIKFV